MDCQKFREILQDLARYEGLDVATLKEALEHAEGCRACDDLLEEADALTVNLRALAERDAVRQAPASIEAALLKSLAVRNAAVRLQTRRRMAAAGILGIAAMALLALVLTRHAKLQPDADTQQLSAALATAVNSSDAQRDALSVFDDEGNAGAFVPLTETFDSGSLDGDAVLRVALSRRDLANFGLSASQLGSQAGKGAGEQVLADLIVSSDGSPQAIRLLPR